MFIRSGRINSSLNFNVNRQNTTTTNFYANRQNIASSLGVSGVSQNPFDWGLPTLSFTNFNGVRDVAGATRINYTEQLSEDMGWNRGKHNIRWGAPGGRNSRIPIRLRIQEAASRSRARTAAVDAAGLPIQGTGFDFADFLLGLPQQTTLQYGALTYYFRGSSWDEFLQDDWRFRGNLTLQFGLRYDYNSPYYESNNKLVNLDVAP